MTMWKYICYVTGVLVGTGLIFAGIYGNIAMPKLIDEKIKKALVLTDGSEAFKKFTNPPVPLQAHIYLFNVTNAEDVIDYQHKPMLEQIGPFVLSEQRRKEPVKFNENNTTLDYRLYRTYFFDKEKSVSLSSVITMPNVAVFAAISSAEEKAKNDENNIATNVLEENLSNETMYITNTAENILFKGIRLTFLDALEKDVTLENPPPNNTFGIYYGKNGTWDSEADGTMTIGTGVGDIGNIGKVMLWNGKSKLQTWKGDHCNTLAGTDGSQFHPHVKKEEKLEIFAPDLCRSLSVEFKQTSSIKSVELYRFGLAPSFYDPIDSSDVTKCYCVKHTPKEKRQFCSLRGVIDLSSCRKKPIIMSTPHFFNGDSSLREVIDGLTPSHEKHDTYIDIEPITGLALRAKRRLQVNVEMKFNDRFELTKPLEKKNRLIHPFLWMDQSANIPDDLLSKLESKLITKIRLYTVLSYVSIVTGILLLLATLLFILYEITVAGKKEKRPRKEKNVVGDVAVGEVLLNNFNNDKKKEAKKTAATDGLIK